MTTNRDYATVKYDSDGAELWVRRYDGPGNGYDNCYAVSVDRQGNSYVTGGVWVNQTKGEDIATIKYSPVGESLWCALYNGPGNWSDEGTAIAVDGDGNVYVAGSSANGLLLDNDVVTIKYVQEGGIAEASTAPSVESSALGVAPSVFRTKATVRYFVGRAAAARVLVFDAGGRRVRTLADGVREGSVNWDGTDDRGIRLPPGVYVVLLEAGDERTQVKVVMAE